ncbi:hypothetical protein ACCQ13_13615 [Xanthomonas sp. NCPPB 1638]|uniref:hypothetical protein n=1 Tax=Xanthomonas TaxID=338 RepID=UPI0013316D0A|nr:hypothetical protein [Xanthomonas cucurbitae]WDM74385.1 hypothetical protein K6982_13290 [Xanthomonas cucurbitae]
MVNVEKSIFVFIIISCILYGARLSQESSSSHDPYGKPGVHELGSEIEPFVQHFGGAPIGFFDRLSIAGGLSRNIYLSAGKLPPLAEFRRVALKSGWVENAPAKSPYSLSYRFCKKRMMLLLEHSYKSHWIYGIEWASDVKGVYYCKVK